MPKRLVAALALAGALLAGCSAATTSGQPTSSPAAAPARVPVARATTAPATTAPATTAPATTAPATTAPTTTAPATTSTPKPAPNPCAGNTQAQLVRVSVATQHLWLCAHTVVAYSTPVTTGAVALPYDSTPTGTFQIQALDTDTTLTLNTGQTYAVKYWIPFQGPLFGFHDSSWQTFPYGSSLYRTQGSHGCVHMPLAAIAYLYRWAHVGATVTIH